MHTALGRGLLSLINQSASHHLGTRGPNTTGPDIVVVINIGNANGAAATNGLTQLFITRGGRIVVNTTSAFHTTTTSRLRA